MMTVKEVSRLTGISIRTLQYYDKLGLLPAMRTESGYRLYDDAALERLQQILLFRELEFPLRDIRTILDNPKFEHNAAERTLRESSDINNQLMALTAGFGALQNLPIDNPAVQAQAAKLQAFITEHYYTCTKEIFAQLGQMYGAGGEFTANINAAGGPGTAEFAAKAIAAYCKE